jgi:hypothetical protein
MSEHNHDVRDGAPFGSEGDAQFERAIGVLADAVRRLAAEDASVRRAIRVVAESMNGHSHGPPSVGASASAHRRGGVGLDLVAQRASVKARACRALADESSMSRAQTQDLLNEARSMRGCWLWMLQPEGEALSSESAQRMAEIYENLARAASHVQGIALGEAPDAEATASAYRLLPEAQSALWVALADVNVQRDQDQIDAFIWLRERTRDERVYLDRFMRREDPADPDQWADLRARVDSASGTSETPSVILRDMKVISVS